MSGIWVEEYFYEWGNIWQKKATDCITKVMTNIHVKGLNASFQKVPWIKYWPKKIPFPCLQHILKITWFPNFQNSYDYLRSSIWNKLILRKKLKNLIKYEEKNPEIRQNYEKRAELIKLMLNSCIFHPKDLSRMKTDAKNLEKVWKSNLV